jgi:dienelactone hydrolase
MMNVHVKSWFMSKIGAFGILCMLTVSLQAQKPLIDTGTANKWPSIGLFKVSNNGAYFGYEIEEQGEYQLILQPTNLKWKITLPDANSCVFTQNNEKALVLRKDSLAIIDLSADRDIHYMGNIRDFKLVNYGKDNNLLLYRTKTMPDELVARDMSSGKERRFFNVGRYWNSINGDVLIFETKVKQDSSKSVSLSWVDMADGKVYEMWKGQNIKTLLLEEKGLQCVFTADGLADSSLGIWRYHRNDKGAEKIIDNQSDGIEKGYHIQEIKTFNGEDNRVFFTLRKDPEPLAKNPLDAVDIWSYKDATTQSAQLRQLRDRPFYMAVLNIPTRKVVRLEYDRERMTSPIYTDKPMRFGLIVKDGEADIDESGWNMRALKSVYLVKLNDGERILINKDLPFYLAEYYVLSYNENYIYYYDIKSRNYFGYHIEDGIRRNLTGHLHAHWTDVEDDNPDSSFSVIGFAKLIKNEDAVLVYDGHAIYTLDPTATSSAANLFHLGQQDGDLKIRFFPQSYLIGYVDRDQRMVFSVFNRSDKSESLFQTEIDSLKYWRGFRLQPYHYENTALVKARDTDLYFVRRMSAETSPNTYMTGDFSRYLPMTEIYPERAYNWMTSELINWKTLDGKMDQGILYKPENFDPLKKYPLLVYYYERLSDGLHQFLGPGISDGELNIPMYVSHGYLVFLPDIHYTIGWPGRSAYNAIVSGVNYLCGRRYVDRTRMGIQGHSWGGFETNYIITHTHLFAAAMSASGISDFVSGCVGVTGDYNTVEGAYEMSQPRMGATLWQKPALYLENSPILRADKVTTPVLIMANKEDGVVPFEQGFELFTALRRLGKTSWMLQYDGQNHNVFDKAGLDFTFRMFQYFNYYLKGEPPPVWMTNGVPAKLKGFESGFETDTSGLKP